MTRFAKTRWFIVSHLSSCPGGARTYLHNLLDFLEYNGVNTVDLLLSPGYTEFKHVSSGLSVNSIKTWIEVNGKLPVPSALTKWVIAVSIATHIVKYSSQECGFVFSSSDPCAILLIPFMLKKNVIVVMHSCFDERAIRHSTITALLGKTFRQLVYHLFCQNSSRLIVAVSPFLSGFYSRLFSLSSSMQYIYPPLRSDATMSSSDSCSNLIETLGGSFVCLTVGAAEVYKGICHWYRVAAHALTLARRDARPIFFVWVGEGSSRQHIQKLIDQNDEQKNGLLFLDYTDSNGLQSVYSYASMYMQPSLRETFGLSALEAMKWGLPLMLARNTGLESLLTRDHDNGFLVDVVDSAIHSNALLIYELARNNELQHSMGQNSKLFYQSRFSKRRWLQTMKRTFSAVVD